MSAAGRLRDIEFPLVIETSDVDFTSEFYNPALSVATDYKRGVGYFTSGWFEHAAKGIQRFAENGGTAKWIVSPHFEQADWKALQKGDRAKRDRELFEYLDTVVSDLEQGLQEETRNTIAWMIADGLLNIQIALPAGDANGDFHDKWGIIECARGDMIAFHGSQNDSEKSFKNYESYSIFANWECDREARRVREHADRFDSIWENSKSGVLTFSLPDSIALDLAQLRTSERPYADPPTKKQLTSTYRWRHQEVAVNRFLERGSGILDMATGTGKTRTALKILDRLRMNDSIDSVVVATYGNDLLDQWHEELLDRFDASTPIYCQYGSVTEMGSFLIGRQNQFEILITSYDTLAELIEKDTSDKLTRALLVADEVHNMGSDQRRSDLKDSIEVFPHRLGLSATPLDPFDETRNDFLTSRVGPIVYEFGIEDAIERGILCELEYEPLFYELSADDKEAQNDAFAQYQAMKRKDPTIPKTRLYIMLARVRKESEEKLPVFETYLNNNLDILEGTLIFVETMEYGKKVQEIIHQFTKNYRTYYGIDDEQNLEDFSNQDVDVLVTSRAISEGISIKSVDNIILFTSTRSRRSTIQRMGRALRTDPSNPDKTATIVDFIVKSDLEQTADNERDSPDRDRYEWLQSLTEITQQET